MVLDRLLGKQELRRSIEELERRLEDAEEARQVARDRLEKAERRRKDAVSERQEAQREVNVLQERVRNLEAELKGLRAERDEGGEEFSRSVSVPPGELLERVGSYRSRRDDLVTLVSPDLSTEEVLDDLEGDLSPLRGLESEGVLYHDPVGVLSLAAVPPVLRRGPSVSYGETFDAGPLEAGDLRRDHVFCLARSDEAALGRVTDGEVSSFRRIETGVKSKHGKGGFSQKRFQRLREEQVEKHVGDAADALEEELETGDFLAVGGDGEVARRVLERLDHPESRTASKALDARDVEDGEDLLRADDAFWEIRVYVV